MTPDLDALLTGLYVEIDDEVIPSGRRRAGSPRRLSDAELIRLALAQVLLSACGEHHWLRMCYARLGHLFPYLPHQPGCHERLKAAAPLLAGRAGRWGAGESWAPARASCYAGYRVGPVAYVRPAGVRQTSTPGSGISRCHPSACLERW